MSEPKKIDLLFYIYLIFLTIISNNNIMIYMRISTTDK